MLKSTREYVLVGIITLQMAALLAVVYQFTASVNYHPVPAVQELRMPTEVPREPCLSNGPPNNTVYKSQRDRLSRELNLQKQENAKKSCELMELRGKLDLNNPLTKVSESGGWCYDASKPDGGEHLIDHPLALKLADFLKGKSVASFGDGPGLYKKVIDGAQTLKLYDAYDGAPYCAEVSGNTVKFLDLTSPQFGLPLYDWIISLEVAEHIPRKYEGVFLDNIARHAGHGVIISWAVPGQGGLAHVNNRPFSYVKERMASLGFAHDPASSKELKEMATAPWLRTNTNVFIRTFGMASEDMA